MPYTVSGGDTLRKIAASLGITWQELYEANRDVIGDDPNLIRAGQTYVVPGDAEWGGTGETAEEPAGTATDAGGGVAIEEGTEDESAAEEGVGANSPDAETQLTILTGQEMEWFFDEQTGKWYVQYGLPQSDKSMLFEATPEQMNALFGEGMRPSNYSKFNFSNHLGSPDVIFSGNISEMEGQGSFEDEVARIVALSLDSGKLPTWAEADGAAMDILYIAQSEGKSTEWVIDQLSQTQGFQDRFPGIENFATTGNLTLTEAVSGFLEYEAGVRRALQTAGQDPAIATPDLVGGLINAGHSLTTINDTVNAFRRMEQFAPSLDAFNSILVGSGFDPLQSPQDIFDFLTGQSSADMYDLYESSSLAESATKAGLGDLFSVQDAIDAAREGNFTLESATAGMQKAAELLLRLRHEVDVNKFGLDHEELLDISLGLTPRSGRSEAEILENVNRAVLSAQKGLQQRATTFKGFDQSGRIRSASLGGLREAT